MYPNIKIPKTEYLENYKKKAAIELRILRKYKTRRITLSMLLDVGILLLCFRELYQNLNENLILIIPFVFLCFLCSVGIDSLMWRYYDSIIKNYNLEILDGLKSGSYEKFVKEINIIIKSEMEKRGKLRYSVFNITETETEYICQVLIRDR